MMDTLEKFYIFRETKLNNQINDKLTIEPNIIFVTIVCHDHYRELPNTYTQEIQLPALPALTSNTLRGTNPMGRHFLLSGGNPR
jgi:hypothetical protein